MVRLSEQAREVAYPQLSKDQIDDVIDALMFSIGNRRLGSREPRFESALSYLISFRTKRWGLPAALRHRG